MNKNNHRNQLKKAKRIVVKIGSALLTNDGKGLNYDLIQSLAKQIVDCLACGIEVVLVSSGSVAAGLSRLSWTSRPKKMEALQAAAAIGQMDLVRAYQQAFIKHQKQTAQILVTHEDLSNRKRYLNAKNTLMTLISFGIVPVVNENDTVVTDEIRFGDNDTLAALVTNLIQADLLIILTNQPGMFEKDPSLDSSAKLLPEVSSSDPILKNMAGGSQDGLGRGGMITKVTAAKLAARSGAYTVIADGLKSDVIKKIHSAESVGTLFIPELDVHSARKRWLAGHLKMKGELTLDDGACRAILDKGASLLPVGVLEVKGSFQRGDMVMCCDRAGRKVAWGLSNFTAKEAKSIRGRSSEGVRQILGAIADESLIHRDNMVLA